MSSLDEELSWSAAAPRHPASDAGRRLVAGLLLVASAALARRAAALTAPGPGAQAPLPIDARVEFHAGAGAPEGLVYIDGELVGRLPGVGRL